MAMNDLLSNITKILVGSGTGENHIGGVVDWVQSIVNCITSNPLILLFVVLSVSLIAVGVVRRLIRL